MSTPNPLSNSSAIRADSVEVWNPLKRKYEAVGGSIVGLAPVDLNSIELLAQAIDNDPNYFQTVAAGLTAKADRVEVDADLALLTDLLNTKASSSALASATAALQAQVDTKASASALAALGSTIGFTANEASGRSLRAAGAMALLCAHVDSDTIKLLGRWHSDEMLCYLTVQAQPIMRDFSWRMLQGGHYTLLHLPPPT